MNEIPDLLVRYLRGPDLVAAAMTGATDLELDFKPAPNKWSVRQIVAHLADTEAIAVTRLRGVIAEDNPALVPFDQDAWAEKTNYSKRKPARDLETIRRLRADNYELLKELPEEAFSRTGRHARRGTMTLLDLLRLFAEHAEKHAVQIHGVLSEYKTSQAAR
ncbi:MAG: DinB family protein [Acidobacteriaceae bacterium]|nr:DinB family protein [Acidobacteriaceae bacterium]